MALGKNMAEHDADVAEAQCFAALYVFQIATRKILHAPPTSAIQLNNKHDEHQPPESGRYDRRQNNQQKAWASKTRFQSTVEQ